MGRKKPFILWVAFLTLVILTACQSPLPQGQAVMAAAVTTVPTTVQENKTEVQWMRFSAPDCEYGGLIREIAAVDASTVRFSFCQPEPAFPAKVAWTGFGIQPSEWLQSAIPTQKILEKPVGTGPYWLEDWNRGEYLVLRRNESYWGESALTRQVVLKWAEKSADRLAELLAGTTDVIDEPDLSTVDPTEMDPTLNWVSREELNSIYLDINNTVAPFDQVLVRQALSYALDRQRLVETAFLPGTRAAEYFMPCGMAYGCDGESQMAFDPLKAKDLLTNAGFPDGFRTTLYYPTTLKGLKIKPEELAAMLQTDLARVGVIARLVALDPKDLFEKQTAGILDGLVLENWQADYPHYQDFLNRHFFNNFESARAPILQIEASLAQAAQITDPALIKTRYTDVNHALEYWMPLIPIAHSGSAVVYRSDVSGGFASPMGIESFAGINPDGRSTLVWMQQAEPASLYCADEMEADTLRVCQQILEPLLRYEDGSTMVVPALATSCYPNEDLTEWTCQLREGVQFQDGSWLDANDVVLSWGILWDASSPLHQGRTGEFEYFKKVWGNFIHLE